DCGPGHGGHCGAFLGGRRPDCIRTPLPPRCPRGVTGQPGREAQWTMWMASEADEQERIAQVQRETGDDDDLASRAEAVLGPDPRPDIPKSWYVIHTYSGYENKVKANLQRRVESMGMEDKIFRI